MPRRLCSPMRTATSCTTSAADTACSLRTTTGLTTRALMIMALTVMRRTIRARMPDRTRMVRTRSLRTQRTSSPSPRRTARIVSTSRLAPHSAPRRSSRSRLALRARPSLPSSSLATQGARPCASPSPAHPLCTPESRSSYGPLIASAVAFRDFDRGLLSPVAAELRFTLIASNSHRSGRSAPAARAGCTEGQCEWLHHCTGTRVPVAPHGRAARCGAAAASLYYNAG